MMTTSRSTARFRFGATLGVLLIATEFTAAGMQVRWGPAVLRQKPEWYASAEARAIADNVIRWQSPHGGWPKNTDLAAVPPAPEALADARNGVPPPTRSTTGPPPHRCDFSL